MFYKLLDFFEFCERLEYFLEVVFFQAKWQLSNIYFNKLNLSAKIIS